MSAEASIPISPTPGKDPPAPPHQRTSSTALTSNPTPPMISTSPHPAPPSTSLPSTGSACPAPPNSINASKGMPPPPSRLSSSSIPYIQPRTEIHSHTHEPPELPRPNFTPIFTLISDTATQSTHHPAQVYYIFSDDDESEVLSAACVRSLQQQPEQESPAAASRELEKSQVSEQTSSSSSATFRKPSRGNRGKGVGKAKARREERVVIVDLNSTGDGIVSTSSLSGSWQIVNAEIENAPTFNNNEAADLEEERGMMLRIEGVGIEEDKEVGGAIMGEDEVQVLLEGFDRKMGELRKIVAAGERWAEERRERGEGGEEMVGREDGGNLK